MLSSAEFSLGVAFPLRKPHEQSLNGLRLYRKCYIRNRPTAPQPSVRSRCLTKKIYGVSKQVWPSSRPEPSDTREVERSALPAPFESALVLVQSIPYRSEQLRPRTATLAQRTGMARGAQVWFKMRPCFQEKMFVPNRLASLAAPRSACNARCLLLRTALCAGAAA